MIGNLLYELIAYTCFPLWVLRSTSSFPYTVFYGVYLLLILVPAVFVYLSTYPNEKYHAYKHVLKWILCFAGVEWIGYRYFHAITYENGWSIWWSLFFDVVMFPMIRLHYICFKWALALSVPCILFYLIAFDYL